MTAISPARCRAIALSICDLQSKLNGSWSAGIGDRTESTGKSVLGKFATRRSQGNKWTVQLWIPNARLINVTVKYVEKLCAKVDGSFLAKKVGFLTQCEIFVLSREGTGIGKRARLVAKSERSSKRERGRISERHSVRVEIRFVGLSDAGDDVHASSAGEMASGEQDVAGSPSTRPIYFRRKSGVII